MRTIRIVLDAGGDMRASGRIIGIAGGTGTAQLRINVTSVLGKSPNATFDVRLHYDDIDVSRDIALETKAKNGNIEIQIEESSFIKDGAVSISIEVHAAESMQWRVPFDILPSDAWAKKGNDLRANVVDGRIHDVRFSLPKVINGLFTEDCFVFLHIHDKNGNRKSIRLDGSPELDTSLVSFEWDNPQGTQYLGGDLSFRFSVEAPGRTVLQSGEETIQQATIVGNGATSLLSDVMPLAYSTAEESNKPALIVNGREINIPKAQIEVGVAGDRNSESVTFECDRYYDGQDLQTKYWYVEVLNAAEEYDITSPTVQFTTDRIFVTWVVNARHAAYEGGIQTRLRATNGVDFVWQTHTGEFTIYKTFDPTDPPGEPGLSMLDTAIGRMEDLLEQSNEATTKSPYINTTTQTWMLWNPSANAFADSGIPARGPVGPGGRIQIANVYTGEPGSSVFITETTDSTPENRIYNLTVPQGEVGNLQFATFGPDFDTGDLLMYVPEGYNGPDFSIEDYNIQVSIGGGVPISLGRAVPMPAGAFDLSKSYPFLAIVYYEGDAYLSRRATQGQTPTDTEYWMRVTHVGEGTKVRIGQVITGAPGTAAAVVNVGTDLNQVWNITIPRGQDGTGLGDMTKAVYDTNGNGVVDDAAALGGVAASGYALKTDMPTDTVRYDTAQTLTTAQQAAVRTKIGLGNVNNTSDASKPISTAMQAALNGKSDTGHTHSQYLTAESDPTVPAWAKAATKPTYTAQETGSVPTTRRVAGKPLDADVVLGPEDVGLANVLLYSAQELPTYSKAQVRANIEALGLSGGTMTGNLIANNPAVGTLAVRNGYAGTQDLTPGVSPLPTGAVYYVYE